MDLDRLLTCTQWNKVVEKPFQGHSRLSYLTCIYDSRSTLYVLAIDQARGTASRCIGIANANALAWQKISAPASTSPRPVLGQGTQSRCTHIIFGPILICPLSVQVTE